MRSQYARISRSLHKQHLLLPTKIAQKEHVIVVAYKTMKKVRITKWFRHFHF